MNTPFEPTVRMQVLDDRALRLFKKARFPTGACGQAAQRADPWNTDAPWDP